MSNYFFRATLISALVIVSFQVSSQNLVKGTVFDSHDDSMVPGAEIVELGSSNSTRSDLNGLFELTTSSDSSVLLISFIGYNPQKIIITSDTTLVVDLFYDFYNTRWLSFGANYGILNQVFGFQLSNGVDEEPLIHFEDFQDNILIKLHGQTDYTDDYSYGGEFGFYLLGPIGRTTLKYDRINFEESGLFLTDLNLTSRIRYFKNTGLILRTGYQKLDGNETYGLGLGFEQDSQNFHFGLNSRYYFDYFHHEMYFQFIIPSKDLLTFRTVYNRIDSTGLLTAGINYAFVRARK